MAFHSDISPCTQCGLWIQSHSQHHCQGANDAGGGVQRTTTQESRALAQRLRMINHLDSLRISAPSSSRTYIPTVHTPRCDSDVYTPTSNRSVYTPTMTGSTYTPSDQSVVSFGNSSSSQGPDTPQDSDDDTEDSETSSDDEVEIPEGTRTPQQENYSDAGNTGSKALGDNQRKHNLTPAVPHYPTSAKPIEHPPAPPKPKAKDYVRRADKGPRPPSKKYPQRSQKQKVFYSVDLLPFRQFTTGTLEIHEIAQLTSGGSGKKRNKRSSRPCPLCGKSFATEHRLKDHLKSSVHQADAVNWGGGGGKNVKKGRGRGKGKGEGKDNSNGSKVQPTANLPGVSGTINDLAQDIERLGLSDMEFGNGGMGGLGGFRVMNTK